MELNTLNLAPDDSSDITAVFIDTSKPSEFVTTPILEIFLPLMICICFGIRRCFMEKVAVIGAGSWGIALANLLANNGHAVTVWSIIDEEIEMLKKNHEHLDKLPGVKLNDSIEYTVDLKEAMEDKNVLVLAVPSPFTRSTSAKMKEFYSSEQKIVIVAKGIEEATLMFHSGRLLLMMAILSSG